MKYVAIYTAVYTASLVLGWYSPGLGAAAVIGLSHLCGLLGVLGSRLLEWNGKLLREAREFEERIRCWDQAEKAPGYSFDLSKTL